MFKAVIIGFAHMHVNEITQYIDECPDFTLAGFADVPPKPLKTPRPDTPEPGT